MVLDFICISEATHLEQLVEIVDRVTKMTSSGFVCRTRLRSQLSIYVLIIDPSYIL